MDLNSLICGSGYGNSCFVDIEINACSLFFFLKINSIYLISRMVIVPSQGSKCALIRKVITEMTRKSINPQIKIANSGYRDQVIGIMSIQH